MTKNTKAFTLIELLIVIVIIGILAVALLPRLQGAQSTARDTARKASLQQIATVASAYVGQASPVAPFTGGTTVASAISNLVIPTYAASLPEADSKGVAFTVTGDATNGYAICATMEKAGQGNVNGTATCATVTGGVAISSSGTGTAYVVKVAGQ